MYSFSSYLSAVLAVRARIDDDLCAFPSKIMDVCPMLTAKPSRDLSVVESLPATLEVTIDALHLSEDEDLEAFGH